MKKSSRNMNPYTLFKAEFFEKIKIFEIQWHFWNQHKILVGKMVQFFLFMTLPILPYFQLLIASKKLQPTNFAIPQVNTPFWSPDTMYFLLKRLKVVNLVTYGHKRVSQKTCHTLYIIRIPLNKYQRCVYEIKTIKLMGSEIVCLLK